MTFSSSLTHTHTHRKKWNLDSGMGDQWERKQRTNLQTNDTLWNYAQTAQCSRVICETFSINRKVLVKWSHGEGVHNLREDGNVSSPYAGNSFVDRCIQKCLSLTCIFSSFSVWLAETMRAFSPRSFLCRVLLLIPPFLAKLVTDTGEAGAAVPSHSFSLFAPSWDWKMDLQFVKKTSVVTLTW